MSGYANISSRCIKPEDQLAVTSEVTFSLSSSDCLEENKVSNGKGVCVCMNGYYEGSSGKCIKRCATGIWKNYQCENCPEGTFPWQ